MKEFHISEKIFLNQSNRVVWDTISLKNGLELFHPFCLKNKEIRGNKKSDELVYLNGLTYIREFTSWKPNQGFELTIGSKNGKKSKVQWQLQSSGMGCELKISVFPYKSSKISKFLYPLVNFFVIKPRLKKYLQSVLKGLKYFLDHKQKVKKNQFGEHPWFS